MSRWVIAVHAGDETAFDAAYTALARGVEAISQRRGHWVCALRASRRSLRAPAIRIAMGTSAARSLVFPRQVEGRADGVSCDGRNGRVAERWEESAQGNARYMAKHRSHCNQ